MFTQTGLAALFAPADLAALALYAASWGLIELLVRPRKGPAVSTGEIMARWRHAWFEAVAQRDNRILDGQLLASMRSGTALYVSGSLIALGGAIAMIGQADQVASVATDLAAGAAAPRQAWTLKLLLMIAVLAAAFLHFVWAHRVFGYCSVMLGAIPTDGSEEALRVAARAARLNVRAARSFNKGLRAVYLALTALAWLLGPLALALATMVTFWVLYRREFLSGTRAALLEE
jgi:uncharacterized membrane protein